MEFKLYRCAHCGNVIFKVVDKGVPVMCCGQKMEEFVPNTTDGAMVEHPMLPEHYISMIAAVDGDTVTMKFPKPGEKPELKTFCRSEKVEAYEICNLHGFWKGEG